jgi:hypothetical protein
VWSGGVRFRWRGIEELQLARARKIAAGGSARVAEHPGCFGSGAGRFSTYGAVESLVAAVASHGSALLPAWRIRGRQAEVVENAMDDGIGHGGDVGGA